MRRCSQWAKPESYRNHTSWLNQVDFAKKGYCRSWAQCFISWVQMVKPAYRSRGLILLRLWLQIPTEYTCFAGDRWRSAYCGGEHSVAESPKSACDLKISLWLKITYKEIPQLKDGSTQCPLTSTLKSGNNEGGNTKPHIYQRRQWHGPFLKPEKVFLNTIFGLLGSTYVRRLHLQQWLSIFVLRLM